MYFLRETNFGESMLSKIAVLTALKALNFDSELPKLQFFEISRIHQNYFYVKTKVQFFKHWF